MRVTGIEKRRVGGRYDVAFDDGSAIALPRATAQRLRIGEDAQPHLLLEECRAVDISDAYERLVRMLAGRARTRSEMERDLLARGFSADVADAALALCVQSGWVDDAAIAMACAQARTFSKAQLRAKLAHRGVDAAALDAAVDTVTDADEAALARVQYGKLMRAGKTPLAAAQALARRGFGYDIVKGLMDEADE